ncbi:putative phosphopantothenoylcysteine decarboxylase protein [Golovinomyces cichoracearum]|uniref:Putative phosphopantothenoylcysteine decarboxylase protein n=1 Tax=Golovinomyces cichoracearum TaxID=62708 RepID=A0A420IDR9_9PEZI|nr:putative phosphopantothenoylcysteine decarboxylase protein [Golovinomyces cichoracearum]
MAVNEQQKRRVLVSSNGSIELAQAVVRILDSKKNVKIEVRMITNQEPWPVHPLSQDTLATQNRRFRPHRNIETARKSSKYEMLESSHRHANELCQWADLLVLAPIDADNIAKMLHGICDNQLLVILRGWDVSKKIVVVPGMSILMWENPVTKKQLDNIRSDRPWIHLMPPMLWYYEKISSTKKFLDYNGFGELVDFIRSQAGLATTDSDENVLNVYSSNMNRRNKKYRVKLPDEIWSLIFERVGDWEISQSLNVYTAIPTPLEWQLRTFKEDDELRTYMRSLEWKILTDSTPNIIAKLKEAPETMNVLSNLCVKLVIKFCMVDLLTYMETNFKDVFWASFGQKVLPLKASAVLGKTKILDWWLMSPSFLSKDYTTEAMDGASKMGFIHVLEWWRRSGLTLKYTEVAMEQASAEGHIDVLDWWKQASMDRVYYPLRPRTQSHNTGDDESHDVIESQSSLPLLPGKSLLTAAQNNQARVLRWWEKSCIPIGHSESVARVASQYGNVNVLDVWLELKGEKMPFDSTILIDPTKNGHLDVLQWWKDLSRGNCGRPGRTIQYKTCDIEEALEDSTRNEKTTLKVKEWWIQNGLNLGLQVQEWTRIKTL